MTVLERKIDIILRYIAAGEDEKPKIRKDIQTLVGTSDVDISKNIYLEDVIIDLLKEIGIRSSLCGHNYIVYAIQISIADSKNIESVTKLLYPMVAEYFGTTSKRVERGIRNAIESAFDRGVPEEFKPLFGSTVSPLKGKATNKEFISACVNEVNRRMRDK